MLNLGCGNSHHPDWVNIDFIAASSKVLVHDLRKTLPIDEGSCDVVYTSHVLEHFSRNEARAFLKECYLVLRPGGLLRIAVPDLETIARLYLLNLEGAAAGDDKAADRHEWMILELLDQLTRQYSGGEMMRYWQKNPMPAEDFVIERLGSEVKRFLEANRQTGQALSAAPPEPTTKEYIEFLNTGESHKWMYDRVSLRSLLESLDFMSVRQCSAVESDIEGFTAFNLDTNSDGSTRKPDSLFMEATKAK
jgi:predicted SAM-dependent methyltransferase